MGKKLGEGAFGSVHLEKINGELVAVKTFLDKDDYTYEKKVFEQLGNSKYIVNHYSFDDNKKKVVMEYVYGQSLDNINFKNLELSSQLYICKYILKGLSYLHNKGMIHRDIKEENIIFDTQRNKIKIIDVGLLCSPKEGKYYDISCKDIAGTTYYIAPEADYEENITYKNDIWSFGVMLFHLLYTDKPLSKNFSFRDWNNDKIFDEVIVPKIYKLFNNKNFLRKVFNKKYSLLNMIIEKCLLPIKKRPTADQLLKCFDLVV